MTPQLKGCLFILLASFITFVIVSAEGHGFHRQKREWIIAPRKLKENHDYTGLQSIARIRSDKENYTKILYYLTGPGVDQPPVGVFQVERETGYVKIFSILDREEIAFYHLKGEARFTDGTLAEKEIDLKITVVDENDCPPVIAAQVGSVNESSAAGTVVMRVIATDADEANTINSKIKYSIVEQSNLGGMFYINAQTGEVIVHRTTLDRETQDTYRLTIKAADLDGLPGGNTGTGQIEIKLLDINDNIPTLEKESYEGSVEENTINVEVMRIRALDMDLMYSDNWLAVFEIVSGNEGGYFSITTDSKTNEGIIMINKALDYEEIKTLDLKIAVSNKAAYNFGSSSSPGGSITSKYYPVKINVVNQKEGPRFQPNVKVVTISEDHTSVSLNQIITTYAAIDSDTQLTATNVRYAKIQDDDNWLIIDRNTADIRLNKLPDRESKYLINGTYYAKIICITTETPSKTATGTIAIQVEDFNDHCPKLTATTHTMCLEDNVIYAVAVDEDEFPNSAPFDFTVIKESSKGKWKVEPLNETAAILRDEANLWPGIYKVVVEVKDQQGKSCADVQVMDVIVCTCAENTRTCVGRTTKTSSFGASGVLLLLLGLLLLLLVPLLLLFCLCGGAAAAANFKAIPFDTKQQLISYHTEGQGEDKEVPLLTAPVEVDGATINIRNVNNLGGKGYLGGLVELGGAAGGGAALGSSILTTENMHMYNQYNQSSGQIEMDYMGAGRMTGQERLYSRYRTGMFDGMALSEQFLGEYYSSKSEHATQQSQQKDALMIYDYEGQESLAGSVSCCSLLENDDDLAFLDDLGPKFKTLAEICRGSALVTETVDAGVSVSPLRPVSPARPSTSTHTHTHTHTESIRDRDHTNINTINTSNVASRSSTFVQEERVVESSATVPKVQDKYVIPSQTLLIQQPAMYYAATPMYVVEQKTPMVLVSGAQQAVGQVASVGLGQGLVKVGGIQSSQGVVFVDRQAGMDGVTGHVAQDHTQGTTSRSRKVLVVENGSSGGEQVAHVAQGFMQTAEQGVELRGQGMQVQSQTFSVGSRGSMGSHEDILMAAKPKGQGNQRVVVQHKKVLVTERNVESSTRA
ncbi:desmoglein-2-like [Cheilinus undulatus]|uniref:desmoglein-2-like n=1 Tax=Cheilinus undulatus TaxID=241271 RepID=UPI001BD45E8E|nr:desmoglein-2-like [Cheilinus undulatus]